MTASSTSSSSRALPSAFRAVRLCGRGVIFGVTRDVRTIAEVLRGRLATEGVGPPFGCELADQALGMSGDAQEDVLQIVERGHVDELTALDERIEQCGATGTLETACNQPVLPTHRDDAELVLGAVIVDG